MSTADRYRRLADVFDATVEEVPPGDWDKPSPCADWTARDVLAHVLDSESDVVTRVGRSIARSVDPGVDPLAAWREVRDGLQAVLDDPAAAALEYESLGATTTIAGTVDRFTCFDLVVHRWDIARAVGKDIVVPAEDIEAANAFLDAMGAQLLRLRCGRPGRPCRRRRLAPGQADRTHRPRSAMVCAVAGPTG